MKNVAWWSRGYFRIRGKRYGEPSLQSPLLAQWLMKNDFEPKVGRKFQFRAEQCQDGVVLSTVRSRSSTL